MAHSIEVFENPRTGQWREVPVGFSWTNLFLGFFIPLGRRDWKWAIIQAFAAIFSVGLSWLVFPFFYNQLYATDLVKDGYLSSGKEQAGEIDQAMFLGKEDASSSPAFKQILGSIVALIAVSLFAISAWQIFKAKAHSTISSDSRTVAADLPVRGEEATTPSNKSESTVHPDDSDHNTPSASDWQVNTRYNGVRGTTDTMLTKRADGYEQAVIEIPTFLMFCPDKESPYTVIETGEPLWERTSINITYRFDGEDAKEDYWKTSDNRNLNPDAAFTDDVLKQRGVWLELPSGEHGTRPVHFNLTSLAQVYKQNCALSFAQ